MTEDRSHEAEYENLDKQTWMMLTGLPEEAYNDWLEMSPEDRRDVVGMMQDPEGMDRVWDMLDQEDV